MAGTTPDCKTCSMLTCICHGCEKRRCEPNSWASRNCKDSFKKFRTALNGCARLDQDNGKEPDRW